MQRFGCAALSRFARGRQCAVPRAGVLSRVDPADVLFAANNAVLAVHDHVAPQIPTDLGSTQLDDITHLDLGSPELGRLLHGAIVLAVFLAARVNIGIAAWPTGDDFAAGDFAIPIGL